MITRIYIKSSIYIKGTGTDVQQLLQFPLSLIFLASLSLGAKTPEVPTPYYHIYIYMKIY